MVILFVYAIIREREWLTLTVRKGWREDIIRDDGLRGDELYDELHAGCCWLVETDGRALWLNTLCYGWRLRDRRFAGCHCYGVIRYSACVSRRDRFG